MYGRSREKQIITLKNLCPYAKHRKISAGCYYDPIESFPFETNMKKPTFMDLLVTSRYISPRGAKTLMPDFLPPNMGKNNDAWQLWDNSPSSRISQHTIEQRHGFDVESHCAGDVVDVDVGNCSEERRRVTSIGVSLLSLRFSRE